MKAFFIALIFFLPSYLSAQDDSLGAMHTDSASISSDSTADVVIDTAAIYQSARSAIYNSPITVGEKPKWYDIEQQRNGKNSAYYPETGVPQ